MTQNFLKLDMNLFSSVPHPMSPVLSCPSPHELISFQTTLFSADWLFQIPPYVPMSEPSFPHSAFLGDDLKGQILWKQVGMVRIMGACMFIGLVGFDWELMALLAYETGPKASYHSTD